MLTAFARATGADVGEAERSLEEYPTLDAFFVRRLQPGCRPWRADPSGAGSPVDGIVGQVGEIAGGRLVQAKGLDYTAAELLADERLAEHLDGGPFVTLYLSPRHYHRIHAPCRGRVIGARHVPGTLLPVNPPAVASVRDLFVRNERLVCDLNGAPGRVAVVAVGATNVGRIESVFDPGWNGPRGGVTNRRRETNRRGLSVESRRYDPPIEVGAGDELMAFHLGSSVVVLFEAGRVMLDPRVVPGREVRVGEPLASAILAVTDDVPRGEA
ncbi:MAG TPA: archaetidylserine decarboxylase [Gemmatimonadota bacterium]|nr:archaetidylserine decarboxylase [Gemmatimonadota bacterium]